MNEQNSSFKVNIEIETKGLYLKFKTDRKFLWHVNVINHGSYFVYMLAPCKYHCCMSIFCLFFVF